MYSFYCRMYCCSSFLVFLKHTYFFTRAGAGAGAGQKKTRSRSRSKMDRLGNTAADNEGVGGGDEGGGSEGGEEPGGVQLAATGLAPPPSNLSTEEMPGRTACSMAGSVLKD